MITQIVTQLKTGSIKNVVPFGFDLPPAPYVVVRQEKDAGNRGTAFRINAHFKRGQNIFLEDYIRNEVGTLLDGFRVQSRHGNWNELYFDDEETPELTDSNDDDTISMDRVYWMPDKLF